MIVFSLEDNSRAEGGQRADGLRDWGGRDWGSPLWRATFKTFSVKLSSLELDKSLAMKYVPLKTLTQALRWLLIPFSARRVRTAAGIASSKAFCRPIKTAGTVLWLYKSHYIWAAFNGASVGNGGIQLWVKVVVLCIRHLSTIFSAVFSKQLRREIILVLGVGVF